MSQVEKLISGIEKLADLARQDAVKDVLSDLEDLLRQGPEPDGLDVWKRGVSDAIDLIRANYLL